MRAVRILFLFLLFAAVIIALFDYIFFDGKSETATVAYEYTGDELIDFAMAIHCDITDVISSNEVVFEKNNTSFTCKRKLLSYEGKAVFFFGADNVVTKVYFIFPVATSWNDVSNRISEQLGESSAAAIYDSGSADAQWENRGYLFYLATDNESLTLSITKHYSDND